METNDKAFTPEELVEQLRTMRKHIPDFGPLSVPDAAALRRTAHVNADFIQAAINTIAAAPPVAAVIGTTADSLQTDRTLTARWSAVEAELRAMLEGVAAANLARRYRVGLATLQAYNITRQLVRQKANAELLPHIDSMRRFNTFGRRRRARTPEQTPPVEKQP